MIQLRFQNTLSGKVENFKPLDPKRVGLYACGPTVYDYAHVGNARPIAVFDTLFRLLKQVYGSESVVYTRNITDVDDKIIDRAKENGESIDAVTERTTKAFHDDVAAIGTLPPDHEPRCTAYIAEMVAMIEVLITKGHAYAADGHALFDTKSFADYGKLSKLNQDEIIEGARVEVASYKKNASDFVLWKPSSDDQPGWDSPWGRGRPGWHIECSAMAKATLGERFDIHAGGLDLIFPHHENEIAQSCCANDQEMAHTWLHNGYVTVNGEKMSKSLGNFYTVHQLLDEGFDGEAIRLALLSAHYRAPLDFSKEKISEGKAQLDRFYGALEGFSGEGDVAGSVLDALADDLNTPQALAELHVLAGEINKASGDAKTSAQALLKGSAKLLGLLQADPQAWFKTAKAGELEAAAIDALIAERQAAKTNKNYARADAIRIELLEQGIELLDGPGGTTDWRRA